MISFKQYLMEDQSFNITSKEIEEGKLKNDYSKILDIENFDCGNMMFLSSLKGCPTKISGDFKCRYTGIKSLRYGPTRVEGSYYCQKTGISSLRFSPEYVGKNFFAMDNNKIKSLEGIGVEYLQEIDGILMLPEKIESHLLGILKIRSLHGVNISNNANNRLRKAVEIIKKHLDNKNINKCKSELKEAGLEEYAQL